MNLIEVSNLKVHFFTRQGTAKAVDGVGFAVEENRTLGLIGESGCGKTTVAMAVMGFVKPPGRLVGGRIVFDGRDLVRRSDEELRRLRGRSIAIIRQEAQSALNPVMNIGRQITEMILTHENVTKKQAWERAGEQLERVGIGKDRSKSFPHEFSGGMKQRAMVAIATACNPRLLILDEPTTGLDVIVQRQLLSMINDLRRDLNLTAIFISHDLSVIAETCDRVGVMYAGKIMEQADAASLYAKPCTLTPRRLSGPSPV